MSIKGTRGQSASEANGNVSIKPPIKPQKRSETGPTPLSPHNNDEVTTLSRLAKTISKLEKLRALKSMYKSTQRYAEELFKNKPNLLKHAKDNAELVKAEYNQSKYWFMKAL